MTNSVAVAFHSKVFVLVACRDVELDQRAAAAGFISVCCSEGQHRVPHRSVLCQSVVTVLHTK